MKNEHTQFLKDVLEYSFGTEIPVSFGEEMFPVKLQSMDAEGVWLSGNDTLMDRIGAEMGEISFRKEQNETVFAVPFDFLQRHPELSVAKERTVFLEDNTLDFLELEEAR